MSEPANCEKCQKRVATVHLTEILDASHKREIHLCAECAAEQGIAIQAPSGIDILTGLIGQQVGKELAAMAGVRCPSCGHTFLAFRTGGLLGCPRDYEVFAKGLMPLLERMHGATEHVGKAPKTAGRDARRRSELAQLRRHLKRAIDQEQFERAAELRDAIRRKDEDRGS
jgi:protein arginine kinase activator